MAEKIVSPGVFSKEIDASFLPAAIGDIGAAVVGPTVKGPALVPTVVNSYSEFQAKFGDAFKSGSNYYQYLTSHAAEQYLKHNNKLTVVKDAANDKVLFLFQKEDDAQRYRMQLESEEDAIMEVVEVDEEVAIKACQMYNYKYTVITPNDFVMPPKIDDSVQKD